MGEKEMKKELEIMHTLFDHLYDNHGLRLLHTELQEIYYICTKERE